MTPAFPLVNSAGGPIAPAAEAQAGTADRKIAGAGRAENPGQTGQAVSEAKANAQGLDSAQLKQLTDLKARDREVRAHEAAHQAAGGQYAGAISYVYERGPDGAQYAVGGEVSIDTAFVEGNPQATIEKMRTVRSAALAPAEPSPQDRAIAAQAMQLMLQAQSELAADSNNRDGQQDASNESSSPSPRVNRDASEAYQSVVGLGEADSARRPSESFQATA